MLGAIIGDIAGSRYEFDNTTNYHFPMFSDKNDFTDDTICTVAVADAILNDKSYFDSVRSWCRKYPHPMGEYGSCFFNWIMRPDPYPYNSYGNGSAMRVSPIAWLFDKEDDVRTQAEKSAAITHNHPEGIKGAIAVAVSIYRMRIASDKKASILIDTAKEFYGENPFENIPPKGYFDVSCQGCVPLALFLASNSSSFEDAVRQAIIYGGDTDTVGAIVGSLAEARFGIPDEIAAKAESFIPEDMLRVLHQFQKVTR